MNISFMVSILWGGIIFWSGFLAIVVYLKTKKIQVNENNILIKKFNKEKILDYKDIEWIFEFISSEIENNQELDRLIIIKYKDNKTGKSDFILVTPGFDKGKDGYEPKRNSGTYKYIKEQILKFNPSYKKEDEPSKWQIIGFIILSLVPFILTILCFSLYNN